MTTSREVNEFPIADSPRSVHSDDLNELVWVTKGDSSSCSSNIKISHNVQEEKYEGDTDHIYVTHSDQMQSTISNGTDLTDFNQDLADFNEQFSYDKLMKQYDITTGKVSHSKKTYCQRLRQRQSTFSKKEKSPEKEDEGSLPDFCTFDYSTTQILKSIIAINSDHSGEYIKIIGRGANSVVLHGLIYEKSWVHDFMTDKDFTDWCWREYAVKVYKLSEDQINNERIFQRVQKEKKHLLLLRQAKSCVPDVIRCSLNIIVMQMLPTASDLTSFTCSPLKQVQENYQTIIRNIKKWYKKLHLVHGRLCSKNILYHNNNIYYIGWSHSVTTDHPLALKKLMRDCHYITKFFEQRQIPVKSTETLFKEITGLNEIDSSILSVIHFKNLGKSRKELLTNPNRTSVDSTCTRGRNCRFKV